MGLSVAATTLVVPDYDEGIAFYVDKLGFDLLEDTILAPGKRWVLVAPPGGAALVLAKAANALQRAAIGKQTGGRVGFFMVTDDFDRDHAELLSKGVAFLEDPRRESYGVVAVFRDPFGNAWDLLQPSGGPLARWIV